MSLPPGLGGSWKRLFSAEQTQKGSPCEILCSKQQEDIRMCMEEIRTSGNQRCMSGAVQAW
eukprot:CAMPEP_0118687754 /NCGR_PEP_ID=MMETSP0800-20121206/8555_1 /TAXON_ID=210618 ORGANISM="Striatella unipunctata, Strain CCMP2910" /NCGR_SAMPLE_ID=MMETSP0800 /ASSEMBLY_ACC=CAM_ASM_000638 /LENGTH=60 /DNA_ID=CAMNT_0006584967 /DNA_START=65 /DNA_END=244 /DNA_ORIENTATION=+